MRSDSHTHALNAVSQAILLHLIGEHTVIPSKDDFEERWNECYRKFGPEACDELAACLTTSVQERGTLPPGREFPPETER